MPSPKHEPTTNFRFGLLVLMCLAFAGLPESALAAKRICGRELVITMSMVCQSFPTFSPTVYNKRTRVNDVDTGDFEHAMSKNWPFNRFFDEMDTYDSNRMYQSYYPKKFWSVLRGTSDGPSETVPEAKETNTRMKRGIVEECCHNACTYEKMREFCLS